MIIKLSFSNSAFPRKCRHSYGLTQSPLSLSESLEVPVTGWKLTLATIGGNFFNMPAHYHSLPDQLYIPWFY